MEAKLKMILQHKLRKVLPCFGRASVKKALIHSSASTSSSDAATATATAATSGFLRRSFLEFFSKSHGHLMLPSSSVVPHGDPSLAFTNAGMNQFKSAILGLSDPPAPRVVNSQKCIRLGGKHNDLEVVGSDGHHHTFFEMMGNWSFGDYFKAEACRMAWTLVTEVYGLPKDRLFVTYFGGSEELALEADEETREVWRSLGVPPDRVLAFGAEDNFWEMAASGPCGPCSEIHYDHVGGGDSRAGMVNRGRDDLVELGNLVFMQFQRDTPGGELTELAKHVVDTGFGLERLAAVKCGSTSNYDTDLFRPLFETVARVSGAPDYGAKFAGANHLDTKYRILVDHARMVTVCLGDGMFPDSNPRLRNVVKQALAICKDIFGCDHRLLVEVIHRVSEVLGEQYPEIKESGKRAEILLEFEEETLRQAEAEGRRIYPKLISTYPQCAGKVDKKQAHKIFDAFKRLERIGLKDEKIDGAAAYDLYTSVGIRKNDIQMLANICNYHFDESTLDQHLEKVRTKSKLDAAAALPRVKKLPKTDSSFVHRYSSPDPLQYQFPGISAKVLAICVGDSLVKDLGEDQEGIVYLDRTSFYAEAGGQVGDVGELITRTGGAVFAVTDCQRVLGSPDHVAHIGKVRKGGTKREEKVAISVGDDVKVRINTAHRISCMQNHTATHLVNEALHQALPLTCQNSSYVGPDYFRLDFSSFGSPVDVVFVTRLEERIHKQIMAEGGVGEEGDRVLREVKKFRDALAEGGLVVLPGERYPEEVSVISLPSGGKEPCCGTHLFRVSDLQSFAVVDLKSMGNGIKSIRCLTGLKAASARERGIQFIQDVFKLNDEAGHVAQKFAQEDVRLLIQRIRKKKKLLKKADFIPYAVTVETGQVLEELLRRLLSLERQSSKQGMLQEMEKVMRDTVDEAFVTHLFDISDSTKVLLSRVTKVCRDKPILVVAQTEDGIYGRSQVPSQLVTSDFDASTWLETVSRPLSVKASPPRGQDGKKVCNFHIIKDKQKVNEGRPKLKSLLREAGLFADQKMLEAMK